MRQISKLLLWIVLSGLMGAFLALPVSATVRYVDGENGSDNNTGLDWGSGYAKATIQAAISSASSGDEIWVRGRSGDFDGIYNERLTLVEGVSVYGGFEGDETQRPTRPDRPPLASQDYEFETVIDASGLNGSVMTAPAGITTATVIDGFTLRKGSYFIGGGIDCNTSSPTITHNRIEYNNTVMGGSGVYTSSGSPVIKWNVIQHNVGAGTVVVIGTYSAAIVASNVFRDNSSTAITDSGSATITNNFISGNSYGAVSCAGGGTHYVGANTIAGNAGYTTALTSSNCSPTYSGNIIAFNESGVKHTGTGAPTLVMNCVYGNASFDYSGITLDPENGNISSDPKLVDLDHGDLHIASDSPCRGTYYNVVAGMDIDGGTRAVPLRDMGADEYSAGSATWTEPVTIMVAGDGDDDSEGDSWETAKLTLQAGITTAAACGGDVLVKEGTYNERITIPAHVHLYGGFYEENEQVETFRDWRTETTTLDGDVSAGSVVQFKTGHLVSRLDGFTVTGGASTSTGGGVYCYFSSPRVVNNTIADNSAATYGGGICCFYSYAEITNNNILANTSTGTGTGKGGGGIYCYYSYTTIANNIIADNTAATNGGGIYLNGGGGNLTNNTIADNTCGASYYGAGIYTTSATPAISNNIVASNSGTNGYGIYNGSGTPTLSYNDFYGNSPGNYYNVSAGTGDISSDPLFTDQQNGDYHIAETSPCVDTGYDSAVVSGSLDIDTQPRQVEIPDKGTAETLVDIGADEWYPDYDEDPMVDNGLPPSDLYNADGDDRCNIRWADSNSGVGYGGSFTFLEGPAWQIDEITVWTVPDMPMYPTYYLGDLYSNVSLYLGTTTLGTGPAMSGTFTAGANATNNNNISVEAAQYGGTTDYEDFDGTSSKLWKITFTNVNWTAPANTTIHFGVHGIPRVDRLWFNHATEGSGTLYKYSTTTSPVMFIPAEGSGWFYDKDTSINVQVKAHPVLQ